MRGPISFMFLMAICSLLNINKALSQSVWEISAVSRERLNVQLDSVYTGGSKAFLEKIYKNIKYPAEARENGRTGKLLAFIQFDQNKKISEIGFYNELGYGLEQEVARTLYLTKGNWIKEKLDSNQVIDIDVAYKLSEKSVDITGDINVTGIHRDRQNKIDNQILMTAEHEEKMMTYFNKKKYKKALEHCEELLRRHPETKKYIRLHKVLINKLN